VILLQIESFGFGDTSRVVREPDDGRGCNEFWSVKDPGHVFGMISKGERRKMRRGVWVGSGCSFRRSQVVQILGFCSNASAETSARRNIECSRRGTGPRYVDEDGITANVMLIISRTEAIEPRVLI
jgi:hypothetical protein